ncbi:R.Pab1 family restriction endonuclease [Helicobacter pylori]|nr:R.Pab1 family restriction endonuclease [Helicobacter pylori]
MSLIKVNDDKKAIEVSIPLTSISGKARVKIRHAFSDYGISTATRKIPFSLKHYVEWQIGYDAPIKDKEKFELTTLKDEKYHFLGANNKRKTLYELSEIIDYAKRLGLISLENLENTLLYFCFSILELKTTIPLLNRTAALKEHALLIIHKTNALVFLEMLKIFGLLSQAHHNDVLKILEKILQN